MTSSNVSFLILAITEIAICVSAAWVMVNEKPGWGWLVAIAILLLLAVRIKE